MLWFISFQLLELYRSLINYQIIHTGSTHQQSNQESLLYRSSHLKGKRPEMSAIYDIYSDLGINICPLENHIWYCNLSIKINKLISSRIFSITKSIMTNKQAWCPAFRDDCTAVCLFFFFMHFSLNADVQWKQQILSPNSI